MPIRILPPILANQIAAGEVVERPSSVVKELVENSLDAGADRVEIDIDKGGAKLIRIRDNGCGVARDELVLALSRHATSKVATLDDLEGINSLGFRGEALASISSVARLTFTSRTAEQAEAWQAQAEGREMSVTVKPAAHPVGTTVEVVDLFFNTPARRKFMRSEKTEFAHIDELVRRIALSRFDATLILRHNGKVVRQYKAANTVAEQERRLAAVCGSPFMHHALAVSSEHSDVRLWGWLATPAGARPQNDLQYTYVNGRMMRDKLINHAIRQAYDELLPADRFAAYVLYIELDPRQVDVNVHPAKHEVRFHQARLIHDFIFQALFTALRQDGAGSATDAPLAETQVELPGSPEITYPGQAPRTEWYGAEHGYRAPAPARDGDGVREGGGGRGGHYQPPNPEPGRDARHGRLAHHPARGGDAGIPARSRERCRRDASPNGGVARPEPGRAGLSADGASGATGAALPGARRASVVAPLAAGCLGPGAGGPASVAAGLLQAAEKPGRPGGGAGTSAQTHGAGVEKRGTRHHDPDSGARPAAPDRSGPSLTRIVAIGRERI